MTEPKTLFINASIEALKGATIVGAAGNLSQVTGDVYPTEPALRDLLGPIAVETEHGTIHFDPQDEVEIIDPDGPQPNRALRPLGAPPAVTEHPAFALATHRLRQVKKRDDFTITNIRFGPRHDFGLTTWDKDYFLREHGDVSIAVDFFFATTADRTRTERFNLPLNALSVPIWDILNTASPTA